MNDGSPRAVVHVLTVSLQGVRPPVRRRLEVPSNITLGALSAVLITVFDWDGDHLHKFKVRDTSYGPSQLVDDGFLGPFRRIGTRAENDAVLGQVLSRPGDVAEWTYDLGEEWEHKIEVVAVQPADPGTIYPRCTGGSGLAPEEDTGRVRRGSFDAAHRQRLDAALARLMAVPGRDLHARGPAPDEVFAGVFPEIDATAGGHGCDCEECVEGGDAGGAPLPVLRPRPDDVLAAAAADTPLVRGAVALAGWLGTGRALTPAKVLRPAEADEAMSQLGLDRAVLPPHRGVDPAPFVRRRPSAGGARRRSAKDLPGLHAVWCAAVGAGLIEMRGQKAHPGPGLAVWQEDAEPGRRLESWAHLLAGYLRARVEAERADLDWYAGPRHVLLPMSVMMLYTAAEAPLWPGMLALGGVLMGDDEDLSPLAFLTLPEAAARWAEVLECWAVTGVVTEVPGQQLGGVGEEMEQLVAQIRELLDGAGSAFGGVGVLAEPVLQSLQQGPFAEVTPFGRYALARVLRGHGLTVPTLGDLVGTPPGELLEALCAHGPAAAAEEIRTWLDARGEGWESAVREVVRSAAVKDESGPMRRLTLPTLIGVVAVAAGPMLREWQADPWLAAAVAVGRFAAGQGPQPTAEQFLWLAVDALSMELDEEEDFAELAERVQVEPMLAEPGGIAAALRLDHPHTREVLRRVAGCLDDRKLAARLRRGLGR